MGKKVKISERIIQKTVGLRQRHHSFFEAHPEFPISEFIRQVLDDQISYKDPKFLEENYGR